MLKKVGSQKSEVSPKSEVISRSYLLPFTYYLLPSASNSASLCLCEPPCSPYLRG